MQVDNVFATGILLRRDGPDRVTIYLSRGDAMFTVKSARGLGAGSLSVLDALPQAVGASLHAEERQKNVDDLAL